MMSPLEVSKTFEYFELIEEKLFPHPGSLARLEGLLRGQYHPGNPFARLIDFIMAPDINQENLFFGNFQGQGYPVAVGEADGMHPLKLALQRVQPQMGLKRVLLQIAQNPGKALLQVRMVL